MSQKNMPAGLNEKGYKVISVYMKLQASEDKTDTDDELVIMDINVLKGRRVRTISPVVKYSKKQTGKKDEKNNDGPVIMDTSILTKHGVKTISPVSKYGCYTDLLLKNREEEISRNSQIKIKRANKFIAKFNKALSQNQNLWLQKVLDFAQSFTFRKWAKEVAFIIIIALFAGVITVFVDTRTNYPSGDIILDRIDRLIRAVELDWGR